MYLQAIHLWPGVERLLRSGPPQRSPGGIALLGLVPGTHPYYLAELKRLPLQLPLAPQLRVGQQQWVQLMSLRFVRQMKVLFHEQGMLQVVVMNDAALLPRGSCIVRTPANEKQHAVKGYMKRSI